jgi:carbon-monoxide dehydrogenase large subunit
MTEFAQPRNAVGARVRRVEDPRLLRGRGRYVDDVRIPGTLHVAFVRSTHAHAKLTSIDVEAARAVPGVVGVFTAADLEGLARPIRALNGNAGYNEADTPPLATGKVRFVGEAVAAVVAENRYQAEDGVAEVLVEYDPLPVITKMDQALAEGAPAIHEDIPSNLFNSFARPPGPAVEAAFKKAKHVVELELHHQRYTGVPMEARAVLASFDSSSGRLTVWLSSQAPHIMRTGLSHFLDIPENKIRVIAPDVGGGFGPKVLLYQEEIVLGALTQLVDAPVKWTSDRSEDLQTTVHGREQIHKIRAAADAKGRVLGVTIDIRASNGAYAPWPFTAALDSGQASENVTGPYDIQAYACEVKAVITNKTPMGPYRGVGRVSACMSIERVMDELAARVGVDPTEIRRRNLVSEFPHTTPVGQVFESGNYFSQLDLLEETLDYKALRAEHEKLRAEGIYRGVGVALAVEQSAYGTKSLGSRLAELTPGYDTSSVRIDPDGHVRVAVGLHSHGQGQETTMAQITAQALGVPFEDVEVVFGDTDVVPYGYGTWASRSTVACGGATVLAANDLRDKIRTIAADMLEASADDLEIADGNVFPRGVPSRSVTVGEVAKRAIHQPHKLPEGVEPGLDVTRRYSVPDPGSFASAMHGAVVEIDIETGGVKIIKYVVSEDCGTMINPLIVEGQIHGGVAQGVGGALLEHLAYDDDGQLVAGSFMDYLLPGFTEVPRIEVAHQESPSPHTAGGWKGMGEGGAINSPVAIVAAVNDALKPFGAVANHTPITPEWVVSVVKGAA